MKSARVAALGALTPALLVAGATFRLVGGAAFASSNAFVSVHSLTCAGIGTLIAMRQPHNPIGWTFVGAGVAGGLSELAAAYADARVSGHGSSRALVEIAACYETLAWVVYVFVPVTFLLLLFPDGRLPSVRWRPLAWLAAGDLAALLVTNALLPGRLADYPQLANPVGVDSRAIASLEGLAFMIAVAGLAGSAASLVGRFHRSTGDLRLQLKWLALAAAVLALAFPIGTAARFLWGRAAWDVLQFCLLSLPAAAGVAMLRHRLYDIDVVIKRTAIYAALTATLAAAYAASVLTLQLLLNRLTGTSSPAVAVSTLTVAALFRPARAWIQDTVDRRFYRRPLDAQPALEAFGERLRDEVALDVMTADLRSVVAETMRPAHVSLWLRSPRPRA